MAAPEKTYMAVVAASAMREYITTFKDECSFGEKQTVSRVDDALKRLESYFKHSGLLDHPHYDKMVEIIVDTMCQLEEKLTIEEDGNT